jgi:hypothetical protein
MIKFHLANGCSVPIAFDASRISPYVFSVGILMLRSAGFQTCRMADFQVGSAALRPAGLETRGTADLEVCATLNTYDFAL